VSIDGTPGEPAGLAPGGGFAVDVVRDGRRAALRLPAAPDRPATLLPPGFDVAALRVERLPPLADPSRDRLN
jgi:hypothetical protein